jgi:hypothetical protein
MMPHGDSHVAEHAHQVAAGAGEPTRREGEGSMPRRASDSWWQHRAQQASCRQRLGRASRQMRSGGSGSSRQRAHAAGGSGKASAAVCWSAGRRMGPVGAVSSSWGVGPRFTRRSASGRTSACARWEQDAGGIWGKRRGFGQ